MHILLITHYFEPDSGAAAVRLTRLAKLLHARGHQVTVLTTMPHYPQGQIAKGYRRKFCITQDWDGLRVIQTWLWATPSPSIVRRLISQVSFLVTCTLRGLFIKRPDVVLIEGQPVFTALAGWFLSRFKRVPYVVNVSDFWPEHLLAVGVLTETHPIYRLFRSLVNLTQRGADGVVALHPPLLQYVEKRIGKVGNSRVIYNAIDLHRFRPALDATLFREKYELGNVKLVSFIGTFGTHMDFDTMLDVAAHFNEREDVRFVFIGTGGQREQVKARLAQGDLSDVRWIGWIDHAEMPLAWCASRLTFWAIHNHELNRGFLQGKIYEAMGSGTPVAIAIEGITSKMVEQSGGGLTVPFGDKEGLIASIERLLDDDVFHAQCSRNARTYAEANFDPEKVTSSYEEMLEGVAR